MLSCNHNCLKNKKKVTLADLDLEEEDEDERYPQ